MPRPSKPPSYILHKPSGQARVRIDGKDHYLGEYDSPDSREKYHRLIAEWLQARRTPDTPKPEVITINELLLAFLQHAMAYYDNDDGKPNSHMHTFRQVLKPMKELYGSARVSSFGPIAFKGVRQRLVEKGLVRTNVNRLMGRVRAIFRWGVENELVEPRVFHALCAVAPLRQGRCDAEESNRVAPVSDVFVDEVLPYCPAPVAALIRLQRLCGARPGELVIMRAIDLKMEGAVWTYSPPTHKGQWRGKPRSIKLGPKCQMIIRPFLTRNVSEYLFSPEESMAERQANKRAARRSKVQPSQRSRAKKNPKVSPRDRYDVASYRRAIDYACRKLALERMTSSGISITNARAKLKEGYPRFHPHQLRHTAGTEVLQEHGAESARAFLGHSSLSATKIYTIRDEKLAEQVAREIG